MKGVIEISFEMFEFSYITKIEFNNASRASIPVINNSVFNIIKLNGWATVLSNIFGMNIYNIISGMK